MKTKVKEYRNPIPTADTILNTPKGIVLIDRKNPPFGHALPGGYINYGETAEHAAKRETKEETGMHAILVRQFHVYSDPKRDPRKHTMTVVFIADGKGKPKADDDALSLMFVKTKKDIPKYMAFDHKKILSDYFNKKY